MQVDWSWTSAAHLTAIFASPHRLVPPLNPILDPRGCKLGSLFKLTIFRVVPYIISFHKLLTKLFLRLAQVACWQIAKMLVKKKKKKQGRRKTLKKWFMSKAQSARKYLWWLLNDQMFWKGKQRNKCFPVCLLGVFVVFQWRVMRFLWG